MAVGLDVPPRPTRASAARARSLAVALTTGVVNPYSPLATKQRCGVHRRTAANRWEMGGRPTAGRVKLATEQRSTRVRRGRSRPRVVAVTGARTFLGRNLVALLEEDASVGKIVVLDIKNAPTAGPKTLFYELDLTQPGVDSRIAEIFHAEAVQVLAHLAFLASPTQATAFAHELESVGTMHLLAACHQHRGARMVVAGTTLAYGPHPANPNFLQESSDLRGLPAAPFLDDKLDVERQLKTFAAAADGRVTLLRMAPILGPTVDNYVARWLSRTLVPTVMGHDPLVQFLHEVDAVAALKLAVDIDCPGVFNVVGEGVLPISTVVKLAGRIAVPVPYGIFRRVSSLLWLAQLSEAPPAFAAALRYLFVADGRKALQVLGFRPAYTTRDAVLDFEGALRLREARLLDHTVRIA